MSYRYDIQKGVIRTKKTTKKLVAGAFTAMAIAGGLTGAAFAAKPANPGCFGQDRAAVLHGMQDGSSPYSTGAPGASEWGAIAGERAGTNGDQNRAYKDACGGSPSV